MMMLRGQVTMMTSVLTRCARSSCGGNAQSSSELRDHVVCRRPRQRRYDTTRQRLPCRVTPWRRSSILADVSLARWSAGPALVDSGQVTHARRVSAALMDDYGSQLASPAGWLAQAPIKISPAAASASYDDDDDVVVNKSLAADYWPTVAVARRRLTAKLPRTSSYIMQSRCTAL